VSASWGELLLSVKERVEDHVLGDPRRFRRSLCGVDEASALRDGKWRALLAARRAWRTVPAYRDFLLKHGLDHADVPLERLPVMTKDSYIRAYPTPERCVGGDFVAAGVAIDESSGSTGRPYNWVRGIDERRRMRLEMARMLGWAFGERPRIAINAFSMGAWATGVNVGEALELHSVVKSTGPDVDKIVHTLEFFGPGPGYFICGYPPFLKLLIDTLVRRDFPLRDYELHGLVGGEGMSEELRRYLLRYFQSCYSGYGASDLAMGIAVETPEAIRIRGLIHDHAQLRLGLLDGDHRVPMVFQYNPISHHIESSASGELIITLTHSQVLSPRIRYNVGDEGCLFSRAQLHARLAQLGHPVEPDPQTAIPFPYMLLFGRRDHTVSVMGANIYPEDVERVLYLQPELAAGLASFLIRLDDGPDGAVRPVVCVEWASDPPPECFADGLEARIVRDLAALNADFRNALCEYPDALRITLEVHGFGRGAFAQRGQRIKNRYLATGARTS
jgi:phenylacetate-CoA ligase